MTQHTPRGTSRANTRPEPSTKAHAQRHAKADAKNRAHRTFWQNLAIDVGVALLLVVQATLSNPTLEWSEIDWGYLALSLTRTGIAVVLAYFMRALDIGHLVSAAPSAAGSSTPPPVYANGQARPVLYRAR